MFCWILPAAAQYQAPYQDKTAAGKIKLPAGFSSNSGRKVPNARGLALGKKGTVFAGSMSEGKVYAITETDGTRKVRIIASALTTPLGVAFQNGSLYVSAVNRILRFDDIEDNLDQPEKPVVITDDFPAKNTMAGNSLLLVRMACFMCRLAHPVIFANPIRNALH